MCLEKGQSPKLSPWWIPNVLATFTKMKGVHSQNNLLESQPHSVQYMTSFVLLFYICGIIYRIMFVCFLPQKGVPIDI